MSHVRVTDDAKQQAARRLSSEGIWVKREFWVDEHDGEVPEGDPAAVGRDYVFEVDYDRIVNLVVEHLGGATGDLT